MREVLALRRTPVTGAVADDDLVIATGVVITANDVIATGVDTSFVNAQAKANAIGHEQAQQLIAIV